jgi:hypothetical protein
MEGLNLGNTVTKGYFEELIKCYFAIHPKVTNFSRAENINVTLLPYKDRDVAFGKLRMALFKRSYTMRYVRILFSLKSMGKPRYTLPIKLSGGLQ